MNKMIIAFIIVIAANGGCTTEVSDDVQYVERPARIVSYELNAKGRTELTFGVSASWNNSCGSFSRNLIEVKDSIVTLTVIGKEPREAGCYHNIIYFPSVIRVEGLTSGNRYSFRFWQSDTTSLDTSIVM